jgi:L-amino acid N-acyltransferase YncA
VNAPAEPTTITSQTFLRPVVPDDRPALLAFYQEFEPRPASLGLPPRTKVDVWLDRLVSCPGFVVSAEGKLVGHAVLCPENEDGEVAVFVHQDFRNRRIGRQLLTALVEEARRLRLRRIWGMTELDNLPMLRLAYSLGFVTAADPSMFEMKLEIPADG